MPLNATMPSDRVVKGEGGGADLLYTLAVECQIKAYTRVANIPRYRKHCKIMEVEYKMENSVFATQIKKCDLIKGISPMSGVLILSYRLKEVINSYVLHCFELQRIIHISATRCPIEMGFGSKCRILNGKVIYVKKSKLNIADM